MNAQINCSASRIIATAIALVLLSNAGVAGPLGSPLSAVINVAPGAVAVIPGDTVCSLREAIINANTDSDFSDGDCTAGSGSDTIVLSLGSTYSASDAYLSTGPAGVIRRSVLPPIRSDISVVGNGSTIERVGDIPMRILVITEDGIATVEGVTLKGGLLTGDGLDGAGVYNEGLAFIRNSTISGNEIVGNGRGAGVFNGGGVIVPPLPEVEKPTLVISNSVIANNSISNVSDFSRAGGAGIFNESGSFTRVEYSTIQANRAEAPGGGIHHSDTVFELISSTVASNTVDCATFAGEPAGAGVYNAFGAMKIANSTISGNHADCSGGVGAGIVAGDPAGGVTLTHSTVTKNLGPGGKALLGGLAIVHRSIILANEADPSFPTDCGIIVGGGGTIDSRGFNVVGGGEGCPDTAPGDEAVTPADAFTTVLDEVLADNGGSTLTHALLDPADTGSDNLAVDRIYRRACTEPADQRDEDRPKDGDGDGDAECDSGAFELDGAPPSGGTTGCQEPFPNEPTWEGTALTSVPGFVTLVRIPCGLLRIKLFDVFNLRVLTYFIQDKQTSQFVDISQEFETIVDDKACISNQGLCLQSTWTGENGPYEDVYVLIAADNEQLPEGALGLSVLDAISQFAEFEQTTLKLVR